nr:uroporphyrin-III C-methyltransferase [uncultured bacterium]
MLAGRRILITRAAEQAGDMARALAALGARTEEIATIRIEPASDMSPLERALALLPRDGWLALTSVNGVEAIAAHLGQAWPAARLAAVGPATAAALARAAGREVALVPARHDAVALAGALIEVGGGSVVLPRGDRATPELPAALRAAGWEVGDVVVYHSRERAIDGVALARRLEAGELDWVTFASPSAVHGLLAALPAPALLGRARLASIGPRTSAAIRAAGLEVAIEAAQATVPGLVAALATADPAGFTGDAGGKG